MRRQQARRVVRYGSAPECIGLKTHVSKKVMSMDDRAREVCRAGLLAGLFGLCSACGGGSSGSSGGMTGIDAGGVRSPIGASATVTGFGSVIAGGVSYATAGAEILVDGAPALESDLQVGQQVVIIGETDADGNATATHIGFEHAVIGPVDSINLDSRQLVILGQSAQTDSRTAFSSNFSPGSLEALSEGDIVAVSGERDASGRLFVTWISRGAGSDYRLLAELDSVDTAAKTLQIDQLSVDYGAAMVEGFASGEPAPGDMVRVIGSRASAGVPLQATLIEQATADPLNDVASEDSARVIVSGFITRFVSGSDIEVAGIPVQADSGTVYVNGSANDLEVDARLRVDGTRLEDGSFTADRIEFKLPGVFRLEAGVEAVDIAAGTLTALGTTIFVDADTRLEDLRSGQRPFGIEHLAVGDAIEVRGYAVPDGIMATSLEREDDEGDAEIELSGFVSALNDPFFEIAGITIATGTMTEFDDMDRDDLFSFGIGWRVEVEGVISGGSVLAEEVERDETNGGDVDED